MFHFESRTELLETATMDQETVLHNWYACICSESRSNVMKHTSFWSVSSNAGALTRCSCVCRKTDFESRASCYSSSVSGLVGFTAQESILPILVYWCLQRCVSSFPAVPKCLRIHKHPVRAAALLETLQTEVCFIILLQDSSKYKSLNCGARFLGPLLLSLHEFHKGLSASYRTERWLGTLVLK